MSGPAQTTSDQAGELRRLDHPVYVYGVMAASDAAGLPGTAGDDVPTTMRAVTEGRLAALVSDLPPDHTPGHLDDVQAHQRVLSQAIERATVIPMRFGMVMDGDDEVRQSLLTRHAGELGDLLDQLDGRVQMMVRGFYAEDALLADVLGANPDLARESAALAQRPETEAHAARVQVGELLSAAVEARRKEVESALLDRLAAVSEDIELEPASSDRVAFSAQLLVRRDHRAPLDALIHDLSEALAGSVVFRYVGPLPPYSFANLSLDADGE
jgi:hypothetical protein